MKVIVYGGTGSLGKCCVDAFSKKKYWVLSIGHSKNEHANQSIEVEKNLSWVHEEEYVRKEVKQILINEKVDAIICVAGGWAGGGIKNKNMIKNADEMWRQSVFPSTISSTLAYDCLKENGLLVLTAARSAISASPNMIGYGIAKAAVLHLAKSLSQPNSNMPINSVTTAILPETLDTEPNRSNMPNGDFQSWTPLPFIAETFIKWIEDKERPKNGDFIYFNTKNGETKINTELNK